MKTLISLVLVLAFPLCAKSQHIGLQVGSTISDMKITTDVIAYNTIVKLGFFGGITVEFPLKNSMAIHTAVNFKSIGTWITDNKDETIWRVNYLDLDVVYEYILPISNVEIFVQGGGYAAYALYGKELFRPENGDDTTEDLNIGTTSDDVIKPFDMGLIIGAGVYFGKIRLSASYQPGLINISNVENWIVRNRVGLISFAYLFNRNNSGE